MGSVMIVEDDDDHAELIMSALRRAAPRVDVERCASGEAALSRLRGEGEHEGAARAMRPRLVLVDLQLPGVSGIDVVRGIKQNAGMQQTAVVVLSSSRSRTDIQASLRAQADSYVTKPVAFDELEAALRMVARYWLGVDVRGGLALT